MPYRIGVQRLRLTQSESRTPYRASRSTRPSPVSRPSALSLLCLGFPSRSHRCSATLGHTPLPLLSC